MDLEFVVEVRVDDAEDDDESGAIALLDGAVEELLDAACDAGVSPLARHLLEMVRDAVEFATPADPMEDA